ncbi:SDR family oxidoreductase [Lichenifustis flavocetrariae]|uniref:SDR family oxidoreductase n=1 Tax=Lichenifustis flavocetrariae TaxID=2949735 RepID=A0AA42CQ19_9HYPH|nr:SDR family oxidoreductase [Lichenifustis flavocetrariae]MCW6511015.1 SDR family oxidoreductase [Lichenifustis flavocetrariae]
MRIGIVGATGFIGRHTVAELVGRGHHVRAFGRDLMQLDLLPVHGDVAVIRHDTNWIALLDGLDGLVIATGSLNGPGMIEAHRDLPRRIAKAARLRGLPRLVLVSAVGASSHAPTRFLRSKAEGEAAILAKKPPGWTILRPSLVYGPGGRSMQFLAAVAALPIRLRLDSGPLRPILVDDVAGAIADLLESSQPLPDAIDAVGPRSLDINAYVDALGSWLGLRARCAVRIPTGLIVAAATVGTTLHLSLLDRDAITMLVAGAHGDPDALGRLTAVRPRTVMDGLKRYPASRADHMAARLGPWPHCLRQSLALLWVGTGLVSVVNLQDGTSLLREAGIDGRIALGVTLGGAMWDVLLGAAALLKPFRGMATIAQAATILLYTAIATALLPGLWGDPLGRLLKNIPLFVATLLLAQISRRSDHG